jgi:hypothetical protein
MKKNIIKRVLLVAVVLFAAGVGYALYLFNMPHRDVQEAETDYKLDVSVLINEYLRDPSSADDKYLGEEGQSKVLVVTGKVKNISKDFNNNVVVVLHGDTDLAGVSCTFMPTSNKNAIELKKGEQVSVKGVIRSGAAYDEDLELYEDVIMEKCDLFQF